MVLYWLQSILCDSVIQLGNFFLDEAVSQVLESLRFQNLLVELPIFEIRTHPSDENKEDEHDRIEGDVAGKLICRIEWEEDVDAAENKEE